MTALNELTLAEARDGLKAKDFSAREIAQAHLDAIEKAQALNAYIVATPDRALKMADVSDAKIAKGEARPLEGCRSASRTCSPHKASTPRPARRSSKGSSRITNRTFHPSSGATAR
ncbi:hypothetical protein GCM10025880_04070 [Methylorubrum aminovorans]|nr:hypothetical protein GCM10025880_04070 [Methylorubrum aminovorans]